MRDAQRQGKELAGAHLHAGDRSLRVARYKSAKYTVEGPLATVRGDFLTRVSTGRKMTPEKVREIAKGRVWTGAQALDRGLVDELGSFGDALKAANKAAKDGLTDLLIPTEEIYGRYSAYDLINEATGEIYVEAGDEISPENLEKLDQAGITTVELLDIDHVTRDEATGTVRFALK